MLRVYKECSSLVFPRDFPSNCWLLDKTILDWNSFSISDRKHHRDVSIILNLSPSHRRLDQSLNLTILVLRHYSTAANNGMSLAYCNNPPKAHLRNRSEKTNPHISTRIHPPNTALAAPSEFVGPYRPYFANHNGCLHRDRQQSTANPAGSFG